MVSYADLAADPDKAAGTRPSKALDLDGKRIFVRGVHVPRAAAVWLEEVPFQPR